MLWRRYQRRKRPFSWTFLKLGSTRVLGLYSIENTYYMSLVWGDHSPTLFHVTRNMYTGARACYQKNLPFWCHIHVVQGRGGFLQPPVVINSFAHIPPTVVILPKKMLDTNYSFMWICHKTAPKFYKVESLFIGNIHIFWPCKFQCCKYYQTSSNVASKYSRLQAQIYHITISHYKEI